MAKKKLTPQEHQADTAANSYQRGAHREKNLIRDEDKCVDDIIKILPLF